MQGMEPEGWKKWKNTLTKGKKLNQKEAHEQMVRRISTQPDKKKSVTTIAPTAPSPSPM